MDRKPTIADIPEGFARPPPKGGAMNLFPMPSIQNMMGGQGAQAEPLEPLEAPDAPTRPVRVAAAKPTVVGGIIQAVPWYVWLGGGVAIGAYCSWHGQKKLRGWGIVS